MLQNKYLPQFSVIHTETVKTTAPEMMTTLMLQCRRYRRLTNVLRQICSQTYGKKIAGIGFSLILLTAINRLEESMCTHTRVYLFLCSIYKSKQRKRELL